MTGEPAIFVYTLVSQLPWAVQQVVCVRMYYVKLVYLTSFCDVAGCMYRCVQVTLQPDR